MAAATDRHETRALLRAHLAAASGRAPGYRHITRRCAVCRRLRELAELNELDGLSAGLADLAPPPAPGADVPEPRRGHREERPSLP
ncbi:hypothetical protein I3F58_21740 [Streptomyces sp. MUM 203J]|uniref:DUF6274 family protein n=1 Tax=Streptomyces sp. MUM 203J TaxID=2791990 RepID=UPI001F04830B|nr:DUF6274 family protein [Streptomyces sp. MUM 203J]MCH0542131.1 hypothetical protein [Streptomyces sp. MUM 203J]